MKEAKKRNLTATQRLLAELAEHQACAYRMYRLAKIRHGLIVKLLGQAALLRHMLVASLVFNALLAVLVALLAGGAR